jgi:hypothetical protein
MPPMNDLSPRPARMGLGFILLALSIGLAGWLIGSGFREI